MRGAFLSLSPFVGVVSDALGLRLDFLVIPVAAVLAVLAAGVTGLAVDALAFLAREAACDHLAETLWQRVAALEDAALDAGVLRRGRRFANEARSYHDFVPRMFETCRNDKVVEAWIIADHRAFRRYGLGAAPPAPQ